VEEGAFVEQPLTGFNYGYWFDCVACGTRINIAADLYEQACVPINERIQGVGDPQRKNAVIGMSRAVPVRRL
jgi:hypothetical protein